MAEEAYMPGVPAAEDPEDLPILSEEELSDWRAHGFTPEEARKWKKTGFSAALARPWKALGISPVAAAQAEQAGYGPPRFAELLKSVRLAPETVAALLARGASEDAIRTWKQAVPTDEILAWSAWCSAEEARAWRKAGCSAQEAKRWHEAGFSVQEARRWRLAGFDLDEALAWRADGFSVKDAETWQTLGIAREEAKEWRKIGIAPEEVMAWRDAGLATPQEAAPWHSEGFPPDVAQRYRERGWPPDARFPEALAPVEQVGIAVLILWAVVALGLLRFAPWLSPVPLAMLYLVTITHARMRRRMTQELLQTWGDASRVAQTVRRWRGRVLVLLGLVPVGLALLVGSFAWWWLSQHAGMIIGN